MGGHHRGRHAVGVAFALEPEGITGVTTELPSGTAGGRHRADPDVPRPDVPLPDVLPVLSVEDFNHLDANTAAATLRACLDIPEWVATVAGGRPYPQAADLQAAGAAAAAVITWPQVSGALDRHPRIGERRAAATGSATETAWSSAEQSGVADDHAQALATGNAEYEQRFGHLFLICASGLSGATILAALRSRLSNDPAAEQAVVMDELRKIAALRLAKVVAQ